MTVRAAKKAASSKVGKPAGGCLVRGGNPRAKVGADVLRVNCVLAPFAPGVTGLVANAQVVAAGKFEQARVTAFANVPPTDPRFIVYAACPPCAMV